MLLFNRTYQNLPKTKFIDYNLAFRYYAGDRKSLKLKSGDQEKTIELPYAEIINFIDEPGAKIHVEGPIGQYQQPEEIVGVTQGAFRAFLDERPNTTNGQVLRVADFQKKGGDYSVRLESSGYFDEVHTSLTLDYPLDSDLFETMRIKDLTSAGNLPAFNKSVLVNHLGVFSAVALYSDGNWYFHMMPRKKNLGVFGGMLSSVSGVVEPPRQGSITELTTFITEELKREMAEETGLDPAELERTGRYTTVPLAFTRELSRGGKPQFFYLTVLHDITEKEFARAFKKTKRQSEFRSDAFSNITALDDVVSPEFSTCLLYSLMYMQKRRKLPTDTIFLP